MTKLVVSYDSVSSLSERLVNQPSWENPERPMAGMRFEIKSHKFLEGLSKKFPKKATSRHAQMPEPRFYDHLKPGTLSGCGG
ncbi:hypothetical protein BDV33DRAFT_178396 [Aspergillus novoparasiticus]|uniref:Uncharacterized protein n=1 Tax=Aspergillus novoparasiticus TaxID=986946 RepID=A0A5N6EHJ7_9EURO|nr:hypothetical protein BDV33DRAFT_178396 [Aspergillus novoparasiticus]